MDGDDELRRLMTAYQAGSLEAFERVYVALATPVLGYTAAVIVTCLIGIGWRGAGGAIPSIRTIT